MSDSHDALHRSEQNTKPSVGLAQMLGRVATEKMHGVRMAFDQSYRRSKEVEGTLQRIEPGATVETRFGEINVEYTQEQWRHALAHRTGLKGEALNHATSLMTAFSQGVVDVHTHYEGKGTGFTRPEIYFVRGMDASTGAAYLSSANVIVLPLERLEASSRIDPNRRSDAYRLGSVVFSGTERDDWYLTGVEECDHAAYWASHDHTYEAVHGAEYRAEWYDRVGEDMPYHDASAVESHWLHTALELPRVQDNQLMRYCIGQRIHQADVFMAGIRGEDWMSLLEQQPD